MASSRAFMTLLRPVVTAKPIKFTVMLINPFSTTARNYVALEKAATDPANKVQIYVSRTSDPFVNLSIEHYLLSKTPVDAHVLFLYTDKPSIILGRNQNPWVEVNNGMLNKAIGSGHKVELVRRRSGGGTVFHDEGNVNYSVVMPTSLFDRDRHAHMVVHALRAIGVSQAKVNERHDIVLAQNSKGIDGDTINEVALPLLADKPLKISGSAYKLTSKKSLHHGTCLLSSPNIATIGQYLKSPAKSFIHAFGTPSVRSPITNVGVANDAFEKAVVAEFKKLYGEAKVVEVTDFDATGVEEISKYYAEQKSEQFTYEKTPQFKFSSEPTEEDPSERPTLPANVTKGTKIQFTARWGEITESSVSVPSHGFIHEYEGSLVGQKIHEIKDWNNVLKSKNGELKPVADWMNALFL